MGIRNFSPSTPSRRFMSVTTNDDITSTKPHKPLTVGKKRTGGRNNIGWLAIRHRGGGHKKSYRDIDFRRDKKDVPGKVASSCRSTDAFQDVRAKDARRHRATRRPAASRRRRRSLERPVRLEARVRAQVGLVDDRRVGVRVDDVYHVRHRLAVEGVVQVLDAEQ